jgi:hypothetical protein
VRLSQHGSNSRGGRETDLETVPGRARREMVVWEDATRADPDDEDETAPPFAEPKYPHGESTEPLSGEEPTADWNESSTNRTDKALSPAPPKLQTAFGVDSTELDLDLHAIPNVPTSDPISRPIAPLIGEPMVGEPLLGEPMDFDTANERTADLADRTPNVPIQLGKKHEREDEPPPMYSRSVQRDRLQRVVPATPDDPANASPARPTSGLHFGRIKVNKGGEKKGPISGLFRSRSMEHRAEHPVAGPPPTWKRRVRIAGLIVGAILAIAIGVAIGAHITGRLGELDASAILGSIKERL